MASLYAVVWFVALIVSIVAVLELVGMRSIVVAFPEAWRWWQFPAQLASLAAFAAIAINHPF